MSSFVEFVKATVTGNYCGMAATALIISEHAVHLPQEIELFWKGRTAGASLLFLANRYLMLLSRLVEIVCFGSISEKSCAIMMKAIRTIELLPYFPWAVFSSLRTYALGQGHLRLTLAVVVFLLSVVPIGINMSTYLWISSATIPMLGCVGGVSYPVGLDKDFVIASRTSLIVADLIVLGVTWRATYRSVQMAHAAGERSKQTFSGTLLRDGTIYFMVLMTLNALHLLFTMLSLALDSLESVSYVSIFTEPITSVLVSRFILDLQEVYQWQASPELPSLCVGSQSSLNFIGALGSSLPALGDTSLGDERLGRT